MRRDEGTNVCFQRKGAKKYIYTRYIYRKGGLKKADLGQKEVL